ncbi:MAG: methyltransferase, partial [Methanomicrobiaceae archaeon]|nr:methyltransferase [Methanomicrobiaceae archaeon]
MSVKQWGIKVNKFDGESVRQRLIKEGLYDKNLKPVSDETSLIFPVISADESSGEYLFEEREIRREPARHELIGGIAIIQDDAKEEAEYLLKSRPSIHTVLHSEGPVSGEY